MYWTVYLILHCNPDARGRWCEYRCFLIRDKTSFFSVKKESQTVFTSSEAVLLPLKPAHLKNWLRGLTFLHWSAVSIATSGLFTAWFRCCSPLLLWSPPAHSDVGWALLRRCCWGIRLLSAEAPGIQLSLRPRLRHWDWISGSPASPRCVHGASVRFCDFHFQGITYHQSLLATQMISIYISYELIHACLRPPRTPIAHADLPSFSKIASVQFPSGIGINL